MWFSTESGELWPLWLSGPLGDDTRYFAHDFSAQGCGYPGLRPIAVANNLSNMLDIGVGNFQGAYLTFLVGLLLTDPACIMCEVNDYASRAREG